MDKPVKEKAQQGKIPNKKLGIFSNLEWREVSLVALGYSLEKIIFVFRALSCNSCA